MEGQPTQQHPETPGGYMPARAAEAEPTLYEVRLTPYRSLDERGFLIVMAIVAGISFVCGVAFLMMGAWPVFGLFGIDVLAVWLAFRVNFRAARAREEITVTPSRLTVRKVAPDGAEEATEMNPLWTRLHAEEIEDFGIQKLTLVSRGRPTEVGGFLHVGEREALAAGLSGALAEARRGIVRSAP